MKRQKVMRRGVMYLAVVGAVGQVADIAMAIHSVRPDLTDVFFVIRQRMMVRLVTGDLDGTMRDLRTLLSTPGLTTIWELRLDPIFDPLRDRPDFQALIAQGN
ncbi:MAG: hypothetical protein O2992_03575 [Gemmatimonadetes bacterium]|nr:hypothetical protein [Gemmatimonadota bacterium]